MKRRTSMCETCPFRDADENYKRECGPMPPENWPCHEEDIFRNEMEIQCRGHFEAARKYGGEASIKQKDGKLKAAL